MYEFDPTSGGLGTGEYLSLTLEYNFIPEIDILINFNLV